MIQQYFNTDSIATCTTVKHSSLAIWNKISRIDGPNFLLPLSARPLFCSANSHGTIIDNDGFNIHLKEKAVLYTYSPWLKQRLESTGRSLSPAPDPAFPGIAVHDLPTEEKVFFSPFVGGTRDAKFGRPHWSSESFFLSLFPGMWRIFCIPRAP